ncbi:MAG: hypothetical protein HC814_06305 [Rhodobacteraceae bacterium]|nr:hypothetical protein [Paracoccaceae bacterium]
MNWRHLIFNNLRWKLFSVFIAVIVWNTYHLGEGNLGLGEEIFDTSATSKFYGLNVRVLGSPDSAYQYQLSPGTVSLKVGGPRDAVDELTLNDLLVYVDVADYVDDDTNQVAIKVRIPPRVKMLEVKPERARLTRLEAKPPVVE